MNPYIKMANEEAEKGSTKGDGGPFGAIIVDEKGQIIARAHNTVLLHHDPTEHAEMNAIRQAAKYKNKEDLSGCTLYTSCEPCSMCLSAIIWSNIKKVYYACTKEDATQIGFRDDMIYEFIKGNQKEVLNLIQMDQEECVKTMRNYEEIGGTIY